MSVEATELFTKTAVLAISGYQHVERYRSFSLSSLEQHRSSLEETTKSLAYEFSYDEEFSDIVNQEYLLQKMGGVSGVSEMLFNQQFRSLSDSIDSTCLVNHFTVLDKVISDFCRCSYLADQNSWSEELENKTIKIGDVIAGNTQEAFRGAFEARMKQLDRGALVKRIDLLVRIFKNGEIDPAETSGNYKFDRARVENISERRNRIMHSVEAKLDFSEIELDLEFMRATGHHILSLMHKRYGLQINPMYL